MPSAAPLHSGLEPFPGYRLRQFLGGGGFGEVWEADAPPNAVVALKFLPCGDDARASYESRGIQMVCQLRHPHLVRMDKVWCFQGYLVVAMELADGSLHDLLEAYQTELKTPIPPGYVCFLLGQAAGALDFLNARQHTIGGTKVALQHCDINPGNLLLFGETVKVSDFSLTSVLGSPLGAHRRAGTLDYAAPEVFQGRLSNWTDQYALAVTYCLLRGGRLPFADTPKSFKRDYVRPTPDLSMLAEEERPVIARGLAAVPMNRWRSCGELIAQLEARVVQDASAARTGKAGAKRPAERVLGADRREATRQAGTKTVSWRRLGTGAAATGTAQVQDVSVTGIALSARARLNQGTVLALTVQDSATRIARPVLVRVVHAQERAGGEWFFGCTFVSKLTSDELRALS
jgi:serine/threonine protein kinase